MHLPHTLTVVACLLVFPPVVECQEGPVVETSHGLVQGRTVATHYDGSNGYSPNVNSFYGIPFAAPPIGELRFEKPVPPESWDGILNATSEGGLPRACTQSRLGMTPITHPFFDNFGEDCLNLNVFTPEDMDPESPYAVMVYFYGGAYLSGANIMYPGHFLAARGVVVVIINYRLSIFGFLNTEDGSYANAALFDQRRSLEWVRDNIAAFGGNPDQVTIFGQSAGASSTGLHMVSPGSNGLFHAAIEQSGCDTSFWAVNWPYQEPWEYTQQTAVKMGCPTAPDADMISCLQEADEWELQGNWSIQCKPGTFCQGHAPVIDGPGGFLPDDPLTLRANDEFSKVPLMSGYNAEDGSLYVIAFIPEALEGGFNRSEFQFMLYDRFLSMWEDQLEPEVAEDAYWATDFQYTPWPNIEDEELNRRALVDMTTDAAWGFPVDRQLKLHSDVAPSYWYIFGYRSTNATEGIFEDTEWAGVPHSGELPYVFGWSLLELAPEVQLDSRVTVPWLDWNQLDFDYAEYTMDLFTNFAKYFDPTPEAVDAPNDHGPVYWPALTKDELNYLWIHIDDVEARVNYRQKEHAFFTEYLHYITGIDLYRADQESDSTPPRGLNSDFMMRSMQNGLFNMMAEMYPEQIDEVLKYFNPNEKNDMLIHK